MLLRWSSFVCSSAVELSPAKSSVTSPSRRRNGAVVALLVRLLRALIYELESNLTFRNPHDSSRGNAYNVSEPYYKSANKGCLEEERRGLLVQWDLRGRNIRNMDPVSAAMTRALRMDFTLARQTRVRASMPDY